MAINLTNLTIADKYTAKSDINLTGNFTCTGTFTHNNHTVNFTDSEVTTSTNPFYIITVGTGIKVIDSVECTDSTITASKVDVSTASSWMLIKNAGGTANEYHAYGTMAWSDPATYTLSCGGLTIIIKDPGTGSSTFTFDTDYRAIEKIEVESGATVRVSDGVIVYCKEFENNGTWDRSTGYGGLIVVGGSSPEITSQSLDDYAIRVNETTTASCDVSNSPDIVGVRINGKDFKMSLSTGTTYSRLIYGYEIGACSSKTPKFYSAKNTLGDTADAGNSITVTASTYATMVDTLQGIIVSILTNDSTVSGYTTKILDGFPTALTKGAGFPHIIVHTPDTKEERKTQGVNPKFRNTLSVSIEIYSRQEGNVREITDAVRNAIRTNQSSTRASGYAYLDTNQTSVKHIYLPGEVTYPVWTSTVKISYRFYS